MKVDWIANDAANAGSENTKALKESIATQLRRADGALSELDRVLVGFWVGKIEIDAVCLTTGDKSVRVYVADIDEDLASKVCMHFNSRPTRKIASCFVKGARKVCVVLGLSQPPVGLDEWVIAHVEKLDLANVV